MLGSVRQGVILTNFIFLDIKTHEVVVMVVHIFILAEKVYIQHILRADHQYDTD